MDSQKNDDLSLRRHLWLLHLPGLVGVVFYLQGQPAWALLLLWLVAFATAVAAAVVYCLPAEMVEGALGRPRLGWVNLGPVLLYLFAGIESAALAQLVLLLFWLHKYERASSWIRYRGPA